MPLYVFDMFVEVQQSVFVRIGIERAFVVYQRYFTVDDIMFILRKINDIVGDKLITFIISEILLPYVMEVSLQPRLFEYLLQLHFAPIALQLFIAFQGIC